jgi:hypoxia-inducible factor 1 alpha
LRKKTVKKVKTKSNFLSNFLTENKNKPPLRKLRKKINENAFCNFSGIENEHEILSCAQLEAQQELSKTVDANALGAISKSSTGLTETKVVKRDNIVLGISDLKQKKVDVKATIGSDNKSAAKVVVVETANNGGQITINPINTIKVNNCEIDNRRPRSVTAAIFAHPIVLSKPEQPATTANKARAQSATAKIFRANSQNVTSVTSKIFAPRTKDMNKGFLTFSEDEAGLTSKYL